MTPSEIKAVMLRLEFRRRHTETCRGKKKIGEWDLLPNRAVCACPYYSCGVHSDSEGFKRRATGKITLDAAKSVTRVRLERGDWQAEIEDPTLVKIEVAIEDFMGDVRDKGAEDSTLDKYTTLMDQLQAFSDDKGITYIQHFGQDEMKQFRRDWEDENAVWKKNRVNEKGKRLWRKNSIGTCKRNKKTMHAFFQRCIVRKWITEDPTVIINFEKEKRQKEKKEVKYLTSDQMTDVLWACDKFDRMPEYNKRRLKALVLVMRWTGLRIGDAVLLKKGNIRGDVIFLKTKKASTDVQIPLPEELVAALATLEPYSGGYYFWHRRSGRRQEQSSTKTVKGNFSKLLNTVFEKAGIPSDSHLVSHRFRNSFAVDLIGRGVPLETVSLMLGHQSLITTENAYADFCEGYMNRAEQIVRDAWTKPVAI
jgi:integrase/recombinase XerD